MLRLSIVIPWRDGVSEFEDTLVSVLQNRPAHCEVLVVHAQPYDDPYDLAGEVRFVHLAQASLIELINAGVQAARSEVVHVVGCGVEVQEAWADAALDRFRDPSVASVAPLVLQRGDRLRLSGAGVMHDRHGARRICAAGQRRDRWDPTRHHVVSPLLTAGFYRRDVLLSLGGFDATVGERFADVDWGLAAEQLGYRCDVAEQSCVVADVPVRGKPSYGAGLAAERFYWRHHPQGRAAMVRHGLAVAAAFLFPLPTPGRLLELAGRIVGMCERQSHQRCQPRVEPSVEPAQSEATEYRRQAA